MESKMPQSAEQELSRIQAAESLYFNMFPAERPEKFRRFLLYVVYNAVQENDGITLNKLQWKLNNDFGFDAADIEIAINALSNKRIFDAISKFHLRRQQGSNGRQIVHLRLRKENPSLIDSWMADAIANNPEYAEMTTRPDSGA